MLDDLSTSSGRPWGFWATFGFGAVVIAVFFLAQAIVGGIFGAVLAATNMSSQPDLDLTEVMASIKDYEGFLIALATITAAFLCTGTIIAIVSIRKNISISEYLGLKYFSRKEMLVSLAAVIGLMAVSTVTDTILDRPMNPPVMVDYYNSSLWPPLFWIAVIIFAPIFEEAFFRGFLFQGFRYSRLGVIGTIILTSLGWAIMHQQYEIFELVSIFILGIALGIIRYKTGSLWIPLILHSFWNLIGIIGLVLNTNGFYS